MRTRPLDFLAERLIFGIGSNEAGGNSDFPNRMRAIDLRTCVRAAVQTESRSVAKPREDANPPGRDPSIILC